VFFPSKIAIDTSTDSTNPLTDPGDVPLSRILVVPQRDPNNLAPPSKTVLVSDVACTVSVYVADDSTFPNVYDSQITQAQLDGRRFWLLQSSLSLSAGTLAALSLPVYGYVYVKVTTPPAGAGTIWAAVL